MALVGAQGLCVGLVWVGGRVGYATGLADFAQLLAQVLFGLGEVEGRALDLGQVFVGGARICVGEGDLEVFD